MGGAFAADVAALTNGSLKIEVLPAGAVVGGLIGSYLDKQAAEMEEIEGATITREGDQLVIIDDFFNRYNFAVTRGCLNIYHAFTPSVRYSVVTDSGPFAVTVLRDGKQRLTVLHDLHPHHAVTRSQAHAAHAAGGAAHGPHIGLLEARGLALAAEQHHVLTAVGDRRTHQRGLWGQFRRSGRTALHAQQLRFRRVGGQVSGG